MADFLKECLSDYPGVPLDQFQRAWCVGCGNRECDRAGLNNSAFDKRSREWKDRFFLKVARAAPDDPAYSNIRAKNFSPKGPVLEVRTPGTPTIEDPSVGPKNFMPGGPRKAEEPVPGHAEVRQETTETPPTEVATPIPDDPANSAPVAPAKRAIKLPNNTGFQQGMMLPGAPPKAEAPAKPAQEAPATETNVYILDDE